MANEDIPLSKYSEWMQAMGPTAYHRWYYNTDVWRHVTFMGVYCAKNVLDLWNYQEIMWELRPGLVVEFGTYAGGTALYLSWVMKSVQLFGDGLRPNVVTVDIDHSPLHNFCRVGHGMTGIIPILLKSTDPSVSLNIIRIGASPILCVLDSDHSKPNVLAELEMLRDLTLPGDYVIVEDSNINGHPVLPDFGPGPWEAIEEYERRHPNDYEHDTKRENKFGMTFNPSGYLRRK